MTTPTITRRNFSLVDGQREYNVITADTAAGSTDIEPGDILVLNASGYWEFATFVDNTAIGVGLATSFSDHTASVDGQVKVAVSNDGLIIEGKVTTPANLAQALVGDRVVLDVSGTAQTVDEDDTTNGAITIMPTVGQRLFDTTDGVNRFLLKGNL